MPSIDGIEDGNSREERIAFFDAVYHNADGDQDRVPWTTEQAKEQVLEWLCANPAAAGQRALDVACGLGENAEALAAVGYQTLAFDVSAKAVEWAKKRYPESAVSYHEGDLFHLPAEWGQFDLVHECYTLQSLPDDLRADAFYAIARMVAPGGALIVYARVRPDGTDWDHAPWPVPLSEFKQFEEAGLTLESELYFDAPNSQGIPIPHAFLVYRNLERS